ncbi:hypothetical protein JXL19_11780 [bacterium]|nr:hypothetical protein [bacterium]
MNNLRYTLGVSLTGLGLILSIISFIGEFTQIGVYKNTPPRPWESFNEELFQRTKDFESFFNEAEKRAGRNIGELNPNDNMDILFNIMIERFTHGEARHTLFTNWILWILGKIYPSFGHIWDCEILLSKGWSLLCDQSSYLLLKMAIKSGISARHVGLYGHVVMEAWYDNDWHLYDPDMEVIAINDAGRVMGVEELSRDKDILLKLYSGPKGSVAELIATRENNTFVSYPPGSRFEWKSEALSRIEQVMEALKLIIPLMMLAFGLFLIFGYRIFSHRSRSNSI